MNSSPIQNNNQTWFQNHKYAKPLAWLQNQGQKQYGNNFHFQEADSMVLTKLICYFLQDKENASQLNINLNKGLLVTGPIGCGKTTLMSLMRLLQTQQNRYIVRSCRDVCFEFINEGYMAIQRYSHLSFKNFNPITYCFDDLGIENNIKYFGNECNVMAEILLSRYDLFVSRQLFTHITTNLSASEIEAIYGTRLRSRLRQSFNLIAFGGSTPDKRI